MIDRNNSIGRTLCPAFISSLLAASPSNPASIAASLGDYQEVVMVNQIQGISQANISGIALNGVSKKIYVVADSRCIIFELDSKGALLRTISTSGFNDLEGICHYKGNEYFEYHFDNSDFKSGFRIAGNGAGDLQNTFCKGRLYVIVHKKYAKK